MAEVLLEFEDRFTAPDGSLYEARVVGRPRENGQWEGWIEFAPIDHTGPVHRTGRETTQPNYGDLRYWATGLTYGFLEGALKRAIDPAPRRLPRPKPTGNPPAYDAPAEPPDDGLASIISARPILDPFAVYAEGDQVLRDQLNALSDTHLRTIIRAYSLAPMHAHSLDAMQRAPLLSVIIEAVQKRAR